MKSIVADFSSTDATSGDCGAAMEFVAFATVDPSGRFVYVPDQGMSASTVLQYGIGAGGTLAPLTPAATSSLAGAQLSQMAFFVRYQ